MDIVEVAAGFYFILCVLPSVTATRQLILSSLSFALVARARTWGDVGDQLLNSGPVSDSDRALGPAGTLLMTEFLYLWSWRAVFQVLEPWDLMKVVISWWLAGPPVRPGEGRCPGFLRQPLLTASSALFSITHAAFRFLSVCKIDCTTDESPKWWCHSQRTSRTLETRPSQTVFQKGISTLRPSLLTPGLQTGRDPYCLAGERPLVQRKALSVQDFKTKIMKMKPKKCYNLLKLRGFQSKSVLISF